MIIGTVHLILGTVEAGKSTELQRLLDTYFRHPQNPKVQCITHTKDNRYGLGASITHSGRQYPAICTNTLTEAAELQQVIDADIIAVDEGHFFPDLYEVVLDWADNGKYVIVIALHASFLRTHFKQVSKLIAVTDILTWLRGVCRKCGMPAANAHRLDAYTSESDTISEGGQDKYEPLCRQCYLLAVKKDMETNAITPSA